MSASFTVLRRLRPTTLLVGLGILLTFTLSSLPEPNSSFANLVSCLSSWSITSVLLYSTCTPSKEQATEQDHASWRLWAAAALMVGTQWLGGNMTWLWVSFLYS